MNQLTPLSPADILATLAELNAYVATPLWLSGGVAVDFLAGRWTRPHGDIDLVAFADDREQLTDELSAIGYRTANSGWITHWFQAGSHRRLEIIFVERDAAGAPVLRIADDDPVGAPGHYPLLPDYLDLNCMATLSGVTFRVCSPAGEWLAREDSRDVVGGRLRDPKLDHDRQLLETLLSDQELAALRKRASRRG